MRKLLAVLAVVGLASIIWATAASACSNTRVNDHNIYFDGNAYPASGGTSPCTFGADTYIYATNPSVLAPDWSYWSSSSAWVGVHFQDAQANAMVAQTGWSKHYSGNRFNWVTFNNGGTNFGETDWTAPALGTQPEYKVTYTYANNTFHYFYQGSNNYNVQYPNGQLGCNYLTSAENVGEIDTLHNQMPGTVGNVQSFSGEQVMTNGGVWWYPTGPTQWAASNNNSNYFYLSQGTVGLGGMQSEFANVYDRCTG